MNLKLPNQLTLARLVLAGLFFVLLALYELPPNRCGFVLGAFGAGEGWRIDLRFSGQYLLNTCFVLYIIAGITDVLDGYLARRMNLTSAFGRIVDPFVDKVLVCGAFALLAGSNFSFGGSHGSFEASLPAWLTGGMVSGVQAWMVVAIIAREFIVSAVRGYSESQGVKFPATVWGKLKLFTQSLAICVVLLQLGNAPRATWAVVFKLCCVWASVAITAISGLAYVNKSRRLIATGA